MPKKSHTTNKTKILSIMLFIVMLTTCIPLNAIADTTIDNNVNNFGLETPIINNDINIGSASLNENPKDIILEISKTVKYFFSFTLL